MRKPTNHSSRRTVSAPKPASAPLERARAKAEADFTNFCDCERDVEIATPQGSADLVAFATVRKDEAYERYERSTRRVERLESAFAAASA